MLGTKHRKDWDSPMKYPNILVENRFDIKESGGNMFKPIF